MITTETPRDWKDLQNKVAEVLVQSGFLNVEVEKKIETVRNSVTVDVFAQEVKFGRTSTLIFECKQWSAKVPQSVVQAFRATMSDCGADCGYIVSKSGFQNGALEAANYTNIRLRTWETFQTEFLNVWIENYLFPVCEEKFRLLIKASEYLFWPTWAKDLDEAGKEELRTFCKKYEVLGNLIAMRFTRIGTEILKQTVPPLPLASALNKDPGLPENLLSAQSYVDVLTIFKNACQEAQVEYDGLKAKSRCTS